MAKNNCAKTVEREFAYEVWVSKEHARQLVGHTSCPMDIERFRAINAPNAWVWFVLKKWQADDEKPNARFFCDVVTPIVPHGEMGDVYASEIRENAVRVYQASYLGMPNNV